MKLTMCDSKRIKNLNKIEGFARVLLCYSFAGINY